MPEKSVMTETVIDRVTDAVEGAETSAFYCTITTAASRAARTVRFKKGVVTFVTGPFAENWKGNFVGAETCSSD